MATAPLTPFNEGEAPAPMAPLTNTIISPENIIRDAKLSRAHPLGLIETWQLKIRLFFLTPQIQRLQAEQAEQLTEYRKLQKQLKPLSDLRWWIVQKRQTEPDNEEYKALNAKLKETVAPLYSRFLELKAELERFQRLTRERAAIAQRLRDNPAVKARALVEAENLKIQEQEARSYEQLIIERLTQLNYCYRWTDRKGNRHIDKVSFSEVHFTLDAVYYKVAASYQAAFGGWRTKLPLGVRIADLIKEETAYELALSCQREVRTKGDGRKGAWIIVDRLDVNDGLKNYVSYRDCMERFPHKIKALIPLCVGIAEGLKIQWLNLASFPHMLIAGFTGSGKSNLINSIICTLITFFSPDEVRLVLVDLKDGVEFASYEQIPHLHGKVIDRTSGLADILSELQSVMQARNREMRGRAKTIAEWNAKYPAKRWPRIICIVDEVASIMNQGELTRQINHSLRELTAKGRAPGIHIILSTQRPSVDAIDGSIKVNLAARIVGRMPSHTDSLTVLGTGEAKELAAVPGRMILQIGPDPTPVQTPYIDDSDIIKALKTAMGYDAPEPLPVPEAPAAGNQWTPERIIQLSLKFLDGNIGFIRVWNEIKDEGGLTRSEVRQVIEHIWNMDVIPFEGKEYRIEKGARGARRLVEITRLPDSE